MEGSYCVRSDASEGRAVFEVKKGECAAGCCKLLQTDGAPCCTLKVGIDAALYILKPSLSCAHTLAVPSFV